MLADTRNRRENRGPLEDEESLSRLVPVRDASPTGASCPTIPKEQLGGTLVLEARDLNHAIQLISQHPRRYGQLRI